MNNVSSAVRSIGVASTAVLSFGACASTATAYDIPDYHQAPSEYHTPLPEHFLRSNTSDLVSFGAGMTVASGPNSLALRLYTNDQLDNAAKQFIFGLKEQQVDIDLETKALISENLWDLYD